MQKKSLMLMLQTKTLKLSECPWTFLLQFTARELPNNSFTRFLNAIQTFFGCSVIVLIQSYYLRNSRICGPPNIPVFIFKKDKFWNFEMIYLKQPPLVVKAFTNCFIIPSFIYRIVNLKIFLSICSLCKIFGSTNQILEAHPTETNDFKELYCLRSEN